MLVSKQDIVVNTASADAVQGLLLSNGDIAVSIFGAPELIVLQVGKNDIWDHRDPSDDLPSAEKHKDFVARFMSANAPEIVRSPTDDPLSLKAHEAYCTPMHTPKPAGQIRFRNISLAGSHYNGKVRL